MLAYCTAEIWTGGMSVFGDRHNTTTKNKHTEASVAGRAWILCVSANRFRAEDRWNYSWPCMHAAAAEPLKMCTSTVVVVPVHYHALHQLVECH